MARLGDWVPGLRPTGPALALGGGLMNHVWRVPADPRPVVLKCVLPHVAAAPEIPVDPSRAGFEAAALDLVGGWAADWGGVRVPRLLHFAPQARCLVLEDLGPHRSLWAALADGLPAQAAGRALGAFIGQVHAHSWGRPTIAARMDNAPVQRTRDEVQYQGVAAWLAQEGEPDAAEGARGLGRQLRGPGKCLVMGDLWPPSVLHTQEGWAVVDWEFAHFGQPGQDLGHLWAHCALALGGSQGDQVHVFWTEFRREYGQRCPQTGPRDWALARQHKGCELLARLVGPFADPQWTGHDPVRLADARQLALDCLAPAAPDPR